MITDNSSEPSTSFFSIQDTLEMGTGGTKLIEGLMSPETSTASPEELQKIDEPKTTQKVTTAKPAPKKEEPKKEDVEVKKTLEEGLLEEEETEEPKKKAKTANEDESSEDDQPEESHFKALAKDLLKLGVFTGEEGEEIDIENPEDFLARFHAEKQKGAVQIVNDFIGQFGEEYQNAFNAIFANGVNPREYFTTFNKIEGLAELDLTQGANQKAVVRQFLIDQDFDQADITNELERLENNGDLEAVSQRYHKALVKKESGKLEQLESDNQKKLEAQKAFKQQYLTNVNTVLENKLKDKVFDGIPLNLNLAKEVRDFLVTEKYKTPSGEGLTDFDVAILNLKKPENHEKKVKIGLLLKILEKDPTLSTIQKTAITKRTDELFSEVQKSGKVQKNPTPQKSNTQPSSKSWFS